MEQVKVSFVVPCLNSGETIKACLEHLKNQAYPQVKIFIVVVDNGSTDSTLELARTLADKVLEAPGESIAAMRNKGARALGSSYIGFVDSDCLLHETWLREALRNFDRPEVGMTGSKTHILPANSTWVARAWKVHLDFSGKGSDHSWLATRAILVKRAAFEGVGGFDESKETCEDVQLGLDIAKSFEIFVDDRLSPLHLKDANTLPELYRKEVWRGADSVSTSLDFLSSGRFRARELLSLALPFYFSIFSFVFGVSVVGKFLGVESAVASSFWSGLFVFIPILAVSARTAFAQAKPESFPALLLVYGVYIVARTRAMFLKR